MISSFRNPRALDRPNLPYPHLRGSAGVFSDLRFQSDRAVFCYERRFAKGKG
jgi:hypothetical protein